MPFCYPYSFGPRKQDMLVCRSKDISLIINLLQFLLKLIIVTLRWYRLILRRINITLLSYIFR